jgi:hypothetical protein
MCSHFLNSCSCGEGLSMNEYSNNARACKWVDLAFLINVYLCGVSQQRCLHLKWLCFQVVEERLKVLSLGSATFQGCLQCSTSLPSSAYAYSSGKTAQSNQPNTHMLAGPSQELAQALQCPGLRVLLVRQQPLNADVQNPAHRHHVGHNIILSSEATWRI